MAAKICLACPFSHEALSREQVHGYGDDRVAVQDRPGLTRPRRFDQDAVFHIENTQ